MSRAPLSKLLLLLTLPIFPAIANATTYYIDYASGNDANNGTSKTSPWQHVPGMNGCTGNCAAASPQAGDQIILKGGVTWPNAAFPITWKWSGANGNNIYIGVDQSWYAGSSWTRPVFDAGGTPIAGNYNQFIRAMSTSYQTWDNIEMKGLNWQKSYPYASMGCGAWNGGQGITIDHMYVHGWSHTGGVTSDNFTCFNGDTNSPFMGDSIIQNSIFDGSDSTNGGDSGYLTYSWPQVKNNVIHDCTNGALLSSSLSASEVSGNLIYNIHQDFDSTVHENAIEIISGTSATYYIHDNVIHDLYGESMFLGDFNVTVYVWNNVVYNLSNANPVHLEDRNAGWTGFFLNNTIVPRSGGQCFLQVGSSAIVTLTLANNHCITSGSLDNISSPITAIRTTNVVMTPTQAAAAGYTASGTYAYSSNSNNCGGQSNCPVAAGSSLAYLWPAGYNSNDTAYACSVISGNVVSCPKRSSLSRSTAWDAGSYVFNGTATAGQPAPPTALTATVN
jgi:hypothetical protein